MVQSSALRRLGVFYVLGSVLLTTALVLLGLLNLVAWAAGSAREDSASVGTQGPNAEARRELYGHLSEAEQEQLLTETWVNPYVYAPWLGFRERPRSGRFVNVSEAGFRHLGDTDRTLSDGGRQVFMLGGSTTFGYGVADDETIAAYLEVRLRERYPREDVRVFNFGRGHYFSGQEQVLLVQLLKAGHVPDMVIFMDGFNEGQKEPFYTMEMTRMFDSMGRQEDGMLLATLLERMPLTKALRVRRWKADDDGERVRPYMALSPEELAAHWQENRRLVAILGAAYGFDSYYFVQPIPGYRNAHLEHASQQPWYLQAFEMVRAKVAAVQALADGESIFDMTGLLEDYEEQPFVDSVHYTPTVNDRIAAFMAERIEL